MPLVELGRRGMHMLLRLIDGHEVEDEIISEPAELVVRASTGPPPA
jgi:DNA-binding LacI/PurR family transcriptional regulator